MSAMVVISFMSSKLRGKLLYGWFTSYPIVAGEGEARTIREFFTVWEFGAPHC